MMTNIIYDFEKTYSATIDTEAMELAVGLAIDAGYRLFDTAYIYQSEGPVRIFQMKTFST